MDCKFYLYKIARIVLENCYLVYAYKYRYLFKVLT